LKIFQIKSKKILNISLDESWDFFSNPSNLPKITPPWLNLKLISDLPAKMYAGMLITYKIYPFPGIPINWITEITQVKEKNFFVDEQRFGPYKFWHHQHHFRDANEGIEMEDIVTYALPFDPLSRPVNTLTIGRKVKEIFKYREEVLSQIFPD
jgi:ligand-binding SRPBCC domain-containing protein